MIWHFAENFSISQKNQEKLKDPNYQQVSFISNPAAFAAEQD